jgi:hypothetical protein
MKMAAAERSSAKCTSDWPVLLLLVLCYCCCNHAPSITLRNQR